MEHRGEGALTYLVRGKIAREEVRPKVLMGRSGDSVRRSC